MTIKHEAYWKKIIIAIISVAALVALCAARYDFYYCLNDDTVIRDIVSGIYTGSPSGYNIQMLYPFNILIAFFYKIIPTVAWYGVVLYAIQLMAIVCILIRLLELLENEKKGVKITLYVLALCFLFGIYLKWLVFTQYTVVSGLLMAGAVFYFLTAKNKKTQVISIVFVVLAFLIRTEMCMMLLPLLALAGIYRWSKEDMIFSKENLRYYLGTVAFAIAIMLIFFGIDRLAYNVNDYSKDWKEYRNFFEARTKLYDFYGIPEYSKDLGLSGEEYTLLNNYNFAIDDDINAELLTRIAEYQKQKLHHIVGNLYTKKSLSEALWSYKNMILTSQNGLLGNVVLILYALILFFYISGNKIKDIWKLLVLLAVRSGLFIYLFLVERCIDRVSYPIIISEIALLIALFILQDIKKRKYLANGLIVVLALVTVCIVLEQVKLVDNEYSNREEILPVTEELIAYTKSNPDNFYYLDVFSTTSYNGVIISEKVFKDVDNSFRNFDICGGWLAKSPLAYEKQRAFDLNNRLYFISYSDKDLMWLTDFYASKGISVDLMPVDTIKYQNEDIYSVYRLNTLSCN